MDRGIATEDRVQWLREQGYRYLVVSRERTRHFDAEAAVRIETASSHGVHLHKVLSDDGQEVREHIPLSGWPISREDLDPYFESALEVCEVPTGGLGLRAFEHDFGYEGFLHHLVPSLEVKNFLFSPPTRFGTRYREDLGNAADVECFLDATLVRLTRLPQLSADFDDFSH